ncbi:MULTISPECIES: PDDEXK nuclease domain-containing protein [Marinomonas]|nr:MULTISPECIES: PDDEXK nuclease domain-containing protein [Marinomonas]GGN31615.1 DUF1016 domain-containing protein [Marinomonas arctica]
MTNSMQKSPEKQITQTSDYLFKTLQSVIKDVKKQVSTQVNSALTMMYWHIGKQIYNELLQQQRAEYGQAIVKALSRKLTNEFGKGFNYSALTRMQKFYSAFPEEPIVATLSQQLNWSHIVLLLPIKDPLAQRFYAQMAVNDHWSVRTLRNRIDSMLFERTALSKKPDELIQQELAQLKKQQITPNLLLKDPYLLDFLDLKDHYLEKDLEDGILRELECFLLELGSGFSFIARQHRVQIGQEDFYIDLLFYNRKLKRLVALDLKLGKFKAAYKGQMELYLRYLAKYEQQPDELAPLGIILCASKDQEQVELLELDRTDIHVGEYLTALPSKEQLQNKLHQVMASRLDAVSDATDLAKGE